MKTECGYPDCEPKHTTCLMGFGSETLLCPYSAEHHNWKEQNTKAGIQSSINNGDPIKALCWKQPFASLMLPPWNKVETRTKRVHIRGLVLIVATKVPYNDLEMRELCGGSKALWLQSRIAGHEGYINGAAIAIGTLHDCTAINAGDNTYIKPEHYAGRYAWRFRDVFAIEPIAMPGFQGWGNVDAETRSKIHLL